MNFKTITHWFAVAIAAIAAFALTPAGHALVAQYPKLTVVFGAAGALAALYHNPKVTSAILICLLLSGGVVAQTNVAVQHFELGGSAVSYMGPGGSAPATIAYGYFNVTKTFKAGYQEIIIPGLATAKLGVGAVGKPLCSWLGKALSAKLVFDCSKAAVDVFAGAGKLNQSALNVNRIAETAGVCVSYSLGANVSANLVCGQYLHGGIVNGFVTNASLLGGVGLAAPQNSTAAVSTGIKVHF